MCQGYFQANVGTINTMKIKKSAMAIPKPMARIAENFVSLDASTALLRSSSSQR